MSDHQWPTDPEEHVWGPWMNKEWNKPKPPIQRRLCVHPDCNAIETREAPRS